MMSQKLSDISEKLRGAGLPFDPTPGRSSDARNPADGVLGFGDNRRVAGNPRRRRRGASQTAFPRRAWERVIISVNCRPRCERVRIGKLSIQKVVRSPGQTRSILSASHRPPSDRIEIDNSRPTPCRAHQFADPFDRPERWVHHTQARGMGQEAEDGPVFDGPVYTGRDRVEERLQRPTAGAKRGHVADRAHRDLDQTRRVCERLGLSLCRDDPGQDVLIRRFPAGRIDRMRGILAADPGIGHLPEHRLEVGAVGHAVVKTPRRAEPRRRDPEPMLESRFGQADVGRNDLRRRFPFDQPGRELEAELDILRRLALTLT